MEYYKKLEFLLKKYESTRSYLSYVTIKIKQDPQFIKWIEEQTREMKFNSKLLSEKIFCIFYHISPTICEECKNNISKFVNFRIGYKKYCKNCSKHNDEYRTKMTIKLKGKKNKNKGKTYKEIFGNQKTKCGFQKGELNVAKNPLIRRKISISVANSYTPELREIRRQQQLKRIDNGTFNFERFKKRFTNSIGEKFRSNPEKDFSELLISNKIPYEYEKVYKLNNGKRKIVDFVLYDFILVEISGYAHKKWKESFYFKLKELRKTVENPIIILSYSEKEFEILSDLNIDTNMYFGSFEKKANILKSISFIRDIQKINNKLKQLNIL